MAHTYVWYHMVYVLLLDFRETFDEPFHIVKQLMKQTFLDIIKKIILSKKLEKLNSLINLRWLVRRESRELDVASQVLD